MFEKAKQLIENSKSVLVIQAENPDGDSLGSALALEEILSDLGKKVSLFSYVEIPKYLRYFEGWDRVSQEFDATCDLAIIVDTSSDTLIGKIYELPHGRHFLESHPVLVIDHHMETTPTLSFEHELLIDEVVATSHIVFNLAENAGWSINPTASQHIFGALMSDSLGLTTQNVTADSFEVASKLVRLGASPSQLEAKRREYSKKSPEILSYKGRLLERIEYYLDGRLALIHIPWDEIEQYSDQYNPSVLVLDEMRMVYDVDIAIAIKTYPDGRLTGKLRSNLPICAEVAGYFGGGGHQYTAGFRVYEDYETVKKELLEITDKAIKGAENEATQHSN